MPSRSGSVEAPAVGRSLGRDGLGRGCRTSAGALGPGMSACLLCAALVAGLFAPARLLAANASAVAAGEDHTCAVTSAGGLRCWGSNAYGQLGDGTTSDRATPTDVPQLTHGVRAVAAGVGHTCALTTTGAVKCWGDNAYGQLGDGTTTGHTTPVDVSGLASGVASLTAGEHHTCAVMTSGGVKCWGDNYYAQLGDSTTTRRMVPVDVSGLTSGVAAVAAGGRHTCAVTTGGGVKCWGFNSYGQLGTASTAQSASPVDVWGLTTGAAAVAAGYSHTCALTAAGGLLCWGDDYSGQSGDGTMTYHTTPVVVLGLTTGVLSVAAAAEHTCALTSGGGVKCWGRNDDGQVGNGTMTTSQLTAADVSGMMSGVVAVAAGGDHACALTGGGGLRCWGDNWFGQAGDGTRTRRTLAVDVSGLTSGVTAVAAGAYHTCALTAAGGVKCWGDNHYGQLGDGTTTNRSTPGDVSGLTSGVRAVIAGKNHTCALTTGGGVTCWGLNGSGQLGDGTVSNRSTPTAVSGLASGVASLAAGAQHSCALTGGGGVKCWGDNSLGQLGDATSTQRLTPTDVFGLTSGVSAVTVGGSHTCAVTTGALAMCWGYNGYGQLGDGTTVQRFVPTAVSGLAGGVAMVAAGDLHTCAVSTGGGVKCWGSNSQGQLGDGTMTGRTAPVAVTGLTSGAAEVGAGALYSCAMTTGGGLRCWGHNDAGELADGTTTYRLAPVEGLGVAGGVTAIASGYYHACAVTTGGGAKCWGNGRFGQLGLGQLWTPVRAGGFGRPDFDADDRVDVAVYRPSSGTWFSLDSSANNATYRYRGWGVQAQTDTPVVGDFDGDGIVDPTVFRPATGTWFILESHANYTTWNWYGWGLSTDTLVPGDYDGDGVTDAAVYRPSNGTWYVRPSTGATAWSVAFGQAGDIVVAGDFDGDGKRDPAVYRPSTGTWFWLTSSSNFTTYEYRGWGLNAQGDTPAPGDYDGDGKTDLCVFRPGTGSWFVLESQAAFTTWTFFGWGVSGDTLVAADYDGDGRTDAAVYRSSSGRWYVRPSSGASPWDVVFGQAGDVPLQGSR
jgi:alpha-tubulin suppressor-like RCC1 family protein